MNFYYLYIAEIVGDMELVDSKPLAKLHKLFVSQGSKNLAKF